MSKRIEIYRTHAFIFERPDELVAVYGFGRFEPEFRIRAEGDSRPVIGLRYRSDFVFRVIEAPDSAVMNGVQLILPAGPETSITTGPAVALLRSHYYLGAQEVITLADAGELGLRTTYRPDPSPAEVDAPFKTEPPSDLE